MEDGSFENLCAALTSDDSETRLKAAHKLGKLGDPRAVEPLGLALTDENNDEQVRNNAIWALGELRAPRAVEPLLKALQNDKVYWLRQNAAEALGKIGDARAAAPLCRAALDHDEGISSAAEEALVAIGGPAVDTLCSMLKDHDSAVRRMAARALERMGFETRDPKLQAWYDIAKGEWERVASLGAAAIAPLAQALQDPDGVVREFAAWALGVIGGPEAVEALGAAVVIDKNPDVQIIAAWSLGCLRAPAAVGPLCAALKESEKLVCEYALEALGKISDPIAVEPIMAKIDLDDPKAPRRTAFVALKNLATGPALAFLEKARHHPDQKVRDDVEFALSSEETDLGSAEERMGIPWIFS